MFEPAPEDFASEPVAEQPRPVAPAPVAAPVAPPPPTRPAPVIEKPKPSTEKPQPAIPLMAENPNKNILSKDVEIKGNIKFTNELIIDGKIEGEISSDGVLTVGENADIRGEIKTKSVTVLGRVQGNITVTERAELKARAHLIGDMKATRLVIEEGATFVGKSEVATAKPTPAAVPGKTAPGNPGSVAQSGGNPGGTAPSTPPAAPAPVATPEAAHGEEGGRERVATFGR